jgi:predicted TIM-barrel fold metal-dependent hydrolase
VVDIVTGLAEAGLPVISHVGAGGDPVANERGAPAHVAALLDRVPGLTLLACHFGGYHRLEEAEEHLVGSRAFLETSWPPTVGDLDRERIRGVLAAHGANRVVFGSDWPMADPAVEIAAIRALGLSPAEEAAVLGNSLAQVLGLWSSAETPLPGADPGLL